MSKFSNEAEATFNQRYHEIGAVLAQARRQEKRTQEECAKVARTTRRRYSLFERGETPVSAVELEALMRFLRIPAHIIWGDLVLEVTPRQFIVQAHSGELLQFVVQVRGE